MTLELQATPEEVMRAVEALQEYGEGLEIPAKVLFGLSLALEECGSNIVNHALHRDPARTFHVSFEFSGGEMVIELQDSGPPFDPTLMPERHPSEDDDDGPPGGWGIQLVRRYTDEMIHTRTAEGNLLRLTKRIV